MKEYKWLRPLGLLVLAGLTLSGAGCLAVAAGAAAAGGVAAGVVYLKAPVSGEFNTDLPNLQAATQLALKDLGLPFLGLKQDSGEIQIGSRTGDNVDIDITLEEVKVRVPAEGPKSRASIRVGFSGDKELSDRILEQMGKKLQPSNGAPQPPSPPLVNSQQTGPPPLAQLVPVAPSTPPAFAGQQTGPPPLAPQLPPIPQTGQPPLASGPQSGPPPLAQSQPIWQPMGN